MNPYIFKQGRIPLIVSIPHAGTQVTQVVKEGLTPQALALPDTDWHLEELYDFVDEIGASLIVGKYSRFVIDLNRPPDDQPLYKTATTGLYPDTLFDGSPIYLPGLQPDEQERLRYMEEIWIPYHRKLQEELDRIKSVYGYAMLYDSHSIASEIPRLFDGQLPDINIGTNSGASCAPSAEKRLKDICAQQQRFSWTLNGRFKGGYITREYGRPENNQHAVQIELAQKNYMHEQSPFSLDDVRSSELKPLLFSLLTNFTL